jgi:GR25 family glycosyltransferase involved in LPS biosynthesis
MARRTRRRTLRKRNKARKQRGGASSPFFQDAYAVTLDPASKRYTDIKAFATVAGIPLQPWKGTKVTPEEKDGLPEQGVGTTHFKDRTGAVFNLGVIGAFLAHRALWRSIATTTDKPGTLIFEDDVEISMSGSPPCKRKSLPTGT